MATCGANRRPPASIFGAFGVPETDLGSQKGGPKALLAVMLAVPGDPCMVALPLV